MREPVLSWRQFRGMAIHQQFIVLLMLGYAALMGVVTIAFASSGEVIAVGTLTVGVAVAVAALTVVPARFGPSG